MSSLETPEGTENGPAKIQSVEPDSVDASGIPVSAKFAEDATNVWSVSGVTRISSTATACEPEFVSVTVKSTRVDSVPGLVVALAAWVTAALMFVVVRSTLNLLEVYSAPAKSVCLICVPLEICAIGNAVTDGAA